LKLTGWGSVPPPAVPPCAAQKELRPLLPFVSYPFCRYLSNLVTVTFLFPNVIGRLAP
jgi:hypothetical protein